MRNNTEMGECFKTKHCSFSSDFRPICASDGKTYYNSLIINCMNKCLTSNEGKLTDYVNTQVSLNSF